MTERSPSDPAPADGEVGDLGGSDPACYDFAFGEHTPYANAMALLRAHLPRGGEVVVDLGCGFGAVAEPVRQLGLAYLGVDSQPAGVKDLLGRGMEAMVDDLSNPEEVLADLDRALGGRQVAAVLMLDAIEHLSNGTEVLVALNRFAARHGRVPLVVSIPNVTHLDVAVKTLLGRFEYTETGLLDSTHVRMFSPSGIDRVMRSAGWAEVSRMDFELSQSDQHYPGSLVALEPSTPLGGLLRSIRIGSCEGAFVNQFVRAYLPGPLPAAAAEEAEASAAADSLGPAGGAAPFLSVLVRTQAKRPHTLVETLLSLAAQDCQDFEVLVLCHDVGGERRASLEQMVGEFHESFTRRVRLVDVCGGGRSRPLNVGAHVARGRYLAVLDDDDMAFGNWVSAFRRLADRCPGRVLRLAVAEQWFEERPGAWAGQTGYEPVDRPRCPYPMDFDLLDHLWENHTPPSGFALPRSLVVDLGQGWDESLPVLEDWDLLLRASSWCGVVDEPIVSALYRRWRLGESSSTVHAKHEWDAAWRFIVAKLDAAPYLLPRGGLAGVRNALNERSELVGRLAESERSREEEITRREEEIASLRSALHTTATEARAQIDEIRSSTSWRLTAPLRSAGKPLARIRHRRSANPR